MSVYNWGRGSSRSASPGGVQRVVRPHPDHVIRRPDHRLPLKPAHRANAPRPAAHHGRACATGPRRCRWPENAAQHIPALQTPRSEPGPGRLHQPRTTPRHRGSQHHRRPRSRRRAGASALLRRHRRHLLTARRHHRLDDVVVARAAADIAFQIMPNLGLAGLRVLLQKRRRRHHHPRRAEPALQPVIILKRLLNSPQGPIRIGHPLDRRDLGAVQFLRKHRARLHRRPIHMHNTRPTLRRVTPNMRPRQLQMLPQQLNQQRPTLNIRRTQNTIHR